MASEKQLLLFLCSMRASGEDQVSSSSGVSRNERYQTKVMCSVGLIRTFAETIIFGGLVLLSLVEQGKFESQISLNCRVGRCEWCLNCGRAVWCSFRRSTGNIACP